jgi:hypothetical protein
VIIAKENSGRQTNLAISSSKIHFKSINYIQRKNAQERTDSLLERTLKNASLDAYGRVFVVIDCNNVAYFQEGVFSEENLHALFEWCLVRERRYNFIWISTKGRVHENSYTLQKAKRRFSVQFVDRKLNEDVRVLKMAERLNGFILSNDRFKPEIRKGLTKEHQVISREVNFDIMSHPDLHGGAREFYVLFGPLEYR